jgi:hypothetical protein
VLDCSGTYGQPNPVGAGGLACPGEEQLGPQHYGLADVHEADRPRFAGRTTLVVGAGYSAATAVTELVRLAEEHPGTQVVWVTRRGSSLPVPAIPHDPLPARAALVAAAQRAVEHPGRVVTWQAGWVVEAIARHGTPPGFRVELAGTSDPAARKTLTVDEILVHAGFRPDRSLTSELQVHECYASQGPMKLAAQLMGVPGGDCLKLPAFGAELLRNPEPGLFILGAKSFGRDSRFLLQTGLRQVHDLLPLLTGAGGSR